MKKIKLTLVLFQLTDWAKQSNIVVSFPELSNQKDMRL